MKWGPHERSVALEQFRLNPSHFHGLSYDGSDLLKRKTFTHAGDNAQLKADLVHIVQNWDKVVAGTDASPSGADVPPCPVSFNPAEAQDALRIEKEYEEMVSQLSQIRGAIGVSVDEWTSNEMFEVAVARAREFKKMAIDSVSDEFSIRKWRRNIGRLMISTRVSRYLGYYRMFVIIFHGCPLKIRLYNKTQSVMRGLNILSQLETHERRRSKSNVAPTYKIIFKT